MIIDDKNGQKGKKKRKKQKKPGCVYFFNFFSFSLFNYRNLVVMDFVEGFWFVHVLFRFCFVMIKNRFTCSRKILPTVRCLDNIGKSCKMKVAPNVGYDASNCNQFILTS